MVHVVWPCHESVSRSGSKPNWDFPHRHLFCKLQYPNTPRSTTYIALLHSPKEVARHLKILCWVIFFSLSKLGQPEQISSVNIPRVYIHCKMDQHHEHRMLNQPIILRQPIQQKNLCWDDCTFGRVYLLIHNHKWILLKYIQGVSV